MRFLYLIWCSECGAAFAERAPKAPKVEEKLPGWSERVDHRPCPICKETTRFVEESVLTDN